MRVCNFKDRSSIILSFPEILFVILYEKDCLISIVSSNGSRVIYKEEIKNKNYKEATVQTIKMKDKVKNIVIASISDARTDFYKYLINNQ